MALLEDSGFRYTCLKDGKTKNCSCCMDANGENTYLYGKDTEVKYPLYRVEKVSDISKKKVNLYKEEDSQGIEQLCTSCSSSLDGCNCRTHKKSRRRVRRIERDGYSVGDFLWDITFCADLLIEGILYVIVGIFRLFGRALGNILDGI